ncbi:MAG: ferrochelatase [Candidatus Omnitrophica bacterium]|nr:ferrochelatase [Candidatus Omnitrophota bacterium]
MNSAAVLVGFGGPARPSEVPLFLESVLQGVSIPKERLEEVLSHYERLGGVSPYNGITQRQRDALERWFSAKKIPLPVYAAYRHSFPSFKDLFLRLKKDKIEEAAVFVLSPFRSYSSFEKYLEKLTEAQKETQSESVHITPAPPFFDHSLFIEAQSQRILEVLEPLTTVLFSAHSIPVKMAKESGYVDEFLKASSLIAKRLDLKNWGVAYQSRSGSPNEPWLEPSVRQGISSSDPRSFRNVLLAPLGFLCENVEVLYDLDVEAKIAAEEKGLRYLRAPAVADHPLFVRMMGEILLQKLGGPA